MPHNTLGTVLTFGYMIIGSSRIKHKYREKSLQITDPSKPNRKNKHQALWPVEGWEKQWSHPSNSFSHTALSGKTTFLVIPEAFLPLLSPVSINSHYFSPFLNFPNPSSSFFLSFLSQVCHHTTQSSLNIRGFKYWQCSLGVSWPLEGGRVWCLSCTLSGHCCSD